MKKVMLLAVISLISVFSTGVYAQSDNVDFGVKAMIGTSNISDQSLKFSYSFGASLVFKFTDMLALQPEIFYSSKGGSKETNINVFNKDVKVITELSYLDIPILGKLIIGNNALLAGPVISFKLSDDITNNANEIQGMGEYINKFKPEVNTLDFSFALGYERKLDERMFVDGRVNFGLTNITDGAEIYPNVNPYKDPKNFSVMFGFKYVLF